MLFGGDETKAGLYPMEYFSQARKLYSLTTGTKAMHSFWGGGLSDRRYQSARLSFRRPLNMKWILLSACACSLLFTTGCLYSHEEWRGHANNARFGGITVEPVVVVSTPLGAARSVKIIAQ